MKQILILIVLIFIGTSLVAQSTKRADSARILYLQDQLKKATGKAEVDILNDLAWEYLWNGLDKSYKTNVDYALLAREKSEKLSYKKGMGYALITISWSKLGENCDSFINTAINLGTQEQDFKLVGRAYHRRWDMKSAYENFKKAGDHQAEAEAATYLCDEYSKKGVYDSEGFKYCQRAIELTDVKKTSTIGYSEFISEFAFEIMSSLWGKVGDYQNAFAYLKQAEKHAHRQGGDVSKNLAELYHQMGRYDSSLFFFEKAYTKNQQVRGLRRQVGTANLLTKNYERAIELLKGSLDFVLNNEKIMQFPVNYKGSLYLELAEAYKGVGNQKLSYQYYRSAVKEQQSQYYKMLNKADTNITFYQRANHLMDISLGLSKSFRATNRIDSAYNFLQRYIDYKNQVQNQNVLWRLNLQLSNFKKAAEDEKRSSQLQLLKKDHELSQVRLKQETTLKNSFAIGMVCLLLSCVFIFRTLHLKRKNEKLRRLQLENEMKVKELESKQQHSHLEQKATELEMQALRAQMNPHFIFNCLSSINRFILKNETEAASDYLTRFSRLIRMVLINSQKSMIPLEDEMEMLRLYLDMERLRFKNSFDYNITYTNTIETGSIMLPPLLLQPFCENAIWHGLMHKEGQGKLDIAINMENNIFQCTIADNGIGRRKASEIKTKSGEKGKSLGLKITTDRLALLNHHNNIKTEYIMHDLADKNGNAAGTKVAININYKGVKELV